MEGLRSYEEEQEEQGEEELYKRQAVGEGEAGSGPLMVCVVKRLTSALLTKEDVLALNTFFLHELLKITQRPGCTLFHSLPRGASTRCTALTGHRRRPQGPERLPDLIDPLRNLSSEIININKYIFF